MIPTSPSLLERLHEGTDNRAWERLVTVYSPLIHGCLRRHGLSPQDAEDIAQNVLAVVVRRIADFRHNGRTGAFRAWLRTIIVNCVRDFRRSERGATLTHNGLDDLDQLADSSGMMSREFDRDHDLHVTRKLLELIRPEFSATTWAAFQRFVLDDVSAAETASELGLTVNAVFIAKSRVMRRLREEAVGILE